MNTGDLVEAWDIYDLDDAGLREQWELAKAVAAAGNARAQTLLAALEAEMRERTLSSAIVEAIELKPADAEKPTQAPAPVDTEASADLQNDVVDPNASAPPSATPPPRRRGLWDSGSDDSASSDDVARPPPPLMRRRAGGFVSFASVRQRPKVSKVPQRPQPPRAKSSTAGKSKVQPAPVSRKPPVPRLAATPAPRKPNASNLPLAVPSRRRVPRLGSLIAPDLRDREGVDSADGSDSPPPTGSAHSNHAGGDHGSDPLSQVAAADGVGTDSPLAEPPRGDPEGVGLPSELRAAAADDVHDDSPQAKPAQPSPAALRTPVCSSGGTSCDANDHVDCGDGPMSSRTSYDSETRSQDDAVRSAAVNQQNVAAEMKVSDSHTSSAREIALETATGEYRQPRDSDFAWLENTSEGEGSARAQRNQETVPDATTCVAPSRSEVAETVSEPGPSEANNEKATCSNDAVSRESSAVLLESTSGGELTDDRRCEDDIPELQESCEVQQQQLCEPVPAVIADPRSFSKRFPRPESLMIDPVTLQPVQADRVGPAAKEILAAIDDWERERSQAFLDDEACVPAEALWGKVQCSRPEVHSVLVEAMSRTETWCECNSKSWDVWWLWRKPRPKDVAWFVTQKVNHIPKTSNLTHKDQLKSALQRFSGGRGSGAAQFELMPLTFNLPRDYVAFAQTFAERRGLWIMKTVGMSRGRGISIVSDISDVSYSAPVVLQEYVRNPLLINGFKFDLRLYVCVLQFDPLEAFVSTIGFARFATSRYTECPDKLCDLSVHLTNTSVAEQVAAGGRNKWSLQQLATSGAIEGWPRVWAAIRGAVLRTLVAVEDRVPRCAGAFELFGVDVILDASLRPWVLEVNASPSMELFGPLDEELKPAMIRDVLQLVGGPAVDRAALRELMSNVSRKGAYCGTRPWGEAVAAVFRGRMPRRFGDPPPADSTFQQLAPSADYDRAVRAKRSAV